MIEEERVDSPEAAGTDGENCRKQVGNSGSKFDFAAVLRKLGDHIAGAFT